MEHSSSTKSSSHPRSYDDERHRNRLYINLKLASSGQPVHDCSESREFIAVSRDLLESYREKSRLLFDHLCPVDRRLQDFIEAYLDDCELDEIPRLPSNTFVLDREGIAREVSLPAGGDHFESHYVTSYRIAQGVLHNPINDRRTTQGSFHIAEGGLPIPGDKKSVPKIAFARMLQRALNPTDELLCLPYTSEQENPARMFTSLLLRPVVCPEIPGREAEKSMEIHFMAPGSLVSNLDFVESIFGNGGNPYLPENDAALSPERWTGHTGCVILAPQVLGMTKRELGLPHFDQATPRQRADGMYWRDAEELYNEGQPFKITARDLSGVIVTILTDNYYGYSKKEVKTQISFSANLYGLAEEEHAGGALSFSSRNHGDEVGADSTFRQSNHNLREVRQLCGDTLLPQPQGHCLDRNHPNLVFVPEGSRFSLADQRITWETEGAAQSIKIQPDRVYMLPNGYKVYMQRHPGSPTWRLIGVDAQGTFCHKPCTVSGGGKSEISKTIKDAILYRPLFTKSIKEDLDLVDALFKRDYGDRLLPELRDDPLTDTGSRPLLSPERSLGSVIKLLTPSDAIFTPEYNTWLRSIPDHVRSLAIQIKRFYRIEWGDDWRRHFTVDTINGSPGHEVKFDDRPIVASYLRVGLEADGSWRIYKLRQDFIAADKVQMEDDITASVVVPATDIPHHATSTVYPSLKLTSNCERRLFQRPDDAIHRGLDTTAERDMSAPGNFLANYEALDLARQQDLVEDSIGMSRYSAPMRDFLVRAYDEGMPYVATSSHPRMVGGKPSKNPRYLQLRPDLVDPFHTYVAEMGIRLHRRIASSETLSHPVDAVLTGRRNNPPEGDIRPLAVYGPIHFQELPELFMDFVCSLTGKSPSTTGAGSEGALTKGPFNALRPTADLNNALVSYILSGYPGFSSAAGHIGPNRRIDHDISMLIPEIWSRLAPWERSADFLRQGGFLEPLEDFEYQGKKVPASRLGWRITEHFVHGFMGRIFDSPTQVLDEALLKPETQDMDAFVDGVLNIVEAQQRVAQRYLDDGSIHEACPPLKALLYIMATGEYQGMDAHHPDIRALFTREVLIESDWYEERLATKQRRDIQLWRRHAQYLEQYLQRQSHADAAARLSLPQRLAQAKEKLAWVESAAYRASLRGTIGADPLGESPCDVATNFESEDQYSLRLAC